MTKPMTRIPDLRVLVFLILSAIYYLAASLASAQVGQEPRTLSVYHLQAGSSTGILILGTSHTNDPTNQQLSELERQYAAFAPTRVFVEGGKWPVAETRAETVSRYGEMAYASLLAKQAGIAPEDADPDLSSEMDHVAQIEGPERTKLYYALRMVRQFRSESDTRSIDEKMSAWLHSEYFKRSALLRGVIANLSELDAAVRDILPSVGDWHSVSPQWMQATNAESPLATVAKMSSQYRAQFLTDKIVASMIEGERVLAVIGLAHLDEQRMALLPALRRKN